jgi:hypothetical protein
MCAPVGRIYTGDHRTFVKFGPPAPLVEPVPGMRPGYTWSPGYWGWQGQSHDWVAGNWMHDRPGYTWQPHHWCRTTTAGNCSTDSGTQIRIKRQGTDDEPFYRFPPK